MAIKGDFVFKKWTKTGEETHTFIVPEGLGENDKFYDKMGQEVTDTQDIGEWQDDPEKSYMNHILVIKACSLHQERLTPDKKIWRLHILYNIYANEEERANASRVIAMGDVSHWEEIDFNEVEKADNLTAFAYDYIKNEDFVRNIQNI